MDKKVSVVILNYKVKDLVILCLKSVLKSTYKPYQIVVVNNSIDDGLAAELAKFPSVEFIQNSANLGYAGGNNIGIRQALKNGADLVFILNPDTTIDKGCIKNLVSAMEKNQADIAGPKIYFNDSKKIWYAGGVLDRLNVIGSHRGMDEIDQGRYNQITETDYASGCALMVSKTVLENVGLFDERYFLYYEDSDFCYRAKIANYKIIYVPGAIVYHLNAKSTGLGSPLQDYYISRNRLVFASKFLPIRTRFALLREMLRSLAIPSRRLALLDFILGNLGKGSY